MTAKPSLFRLRGLWTAWGLQNGTLDPAALVDRAAAAGFRWIAAQPPVPADALAALRERCRVRGVYFGIWEEIDELPMLAYPEWLDVVKPNFWIANVEKTHGAQYGPMLHAIRQKHPLLPLGLATNFGGFDYDRNPDGTTKQYQGRPVCSNAVPWVAANVKCLPEAYQVDQPNLTPAAVSFEARQRGWQLAFPVVGCYHEYPLARYDLKDSPGWSVYLAEEMTDADWDHARQLSAR